MASISLLSLNSCLFMFKFLYNFQPTDPMMGGRCEPGYYCPQSSGLPIPCTEGYYCNISGLDTEQNVCDPGWYCPTGSPSPQQLICPMVYNLCVCVCVCVSVSVETPTHIEYKIMSTTFGC